MKKIENDRVASQGPITRRSFHKLALGAIGAVATPTLARTAAAGHHEAGEGDTEKAPELVTDVKANELLLGQVKYVPVSEKEGQRCANCALLLQQDGDYGRCGLFQQGKVPIDAWCTSWIQRQGS